MRIPPPFIANATKHGLSKRQAEIAFMLSQGEPWKAIAAEQRISMRTIAYHSNVIKWRMHAPNLLSAIVKLLS